MKKMPAHLPPLPDGAVYLGECEEIATSSGHRERHNGWFCGITRRWGDFHEWNVGPDSGSGHFAAPADSEIARLNGCGKPSWDEAPEWAEWLAQDKNGEWCWYENKPGLFDEMWDVGAGGDYRNDVKGPRNPNWRDTLERRPGKPFYESADDAENEIRWASGESADFYFGTIKCDATPDLIIPKDAADQIGLSMIVADLSEIGYRVEVDRGVVRGWARE